MGKLNPYFIVPTGDTVYPDSESPRARTVELARYHWHRMYSLPQHIEFHRRVPGYWEVDDHDSWCNDCWPTMKAKWMNPLTFEQGFAIYREQVRRMMYRQSPFAIMVCTVKSYMNSMQLRPISRHGQTVGLTLRKDACEASRIKHILRHHNL